MSDVGERSVQGNLVAEQGVEAIGVEELLAFLLESRGEVVRQPLFPGARSLLVQLLLCVVVPVYLCEARPLLQSGVREHVTSATSLRGKGMGLGGKEEDWG